MSLGMVPVFSRIYLGCSMTPVTEAAGKVIQENNLVASSQTGFVGFGSHKPSVPSVGAAIDI